MPHLQAPETGQEVVQPMRERTLNAGGSHHQRHQVRHMGVQDARVYACQVHHCASILTSKQIE